MKNAFILAGLLGLASLAACSESPTENEGAGLTAAETAALAPELDDLSEVVINGEATAASASLGATDGAAGSAAADVLEFTRTRDCRGGGTLTVQGRVERTMDRATRTVTVDSRATVTPDDCVRKLRHREGATVKISGNPNLQVEAHRKLIERRFSGLQTSTTKGSFTWERADGASGSCDVDIRAEIDPDAKTKKVTGTVCGRTVDRTWSWGDDQDD